MIFSALNSTAADYCGDCGIVIAGGRAVVTAAAVIFLIGERLRRKLIFAGKPGSHIRDLTAENEGHNTRHTVLNMSKTLGQYF